jgi:GNAT superfamily N-acetyltransferase
MDEAVARRATTADRGAVVATVVRAFEVDPLVRWFFPEELTYTTRAAAFFGYLFDIRVEHGEVTLADQGNAAALWTPPGGVTMTQAEQDERWTAQVEPGAGPGEMSRLEVFDEAVQRMTPDEPHWYLGVLGTDPAHRGRGLARAVLGPVLRRADRDATSVLLETGTPGNLPFYARFGFEELATTALAEGPTVWVLRHAPRVRRRWATLPP